MSERERGDPREGGSESERAEVRRKEEGREGGRQIAKITVQNIIIHTTVHEYRIHRDLVYILYTRQYLTLVGLFQ